MWSRLTRSIRPIQSEPEPEAPPPAPEPVPEKPQLPVSKPVYVRPRAQTEDIEKLLGGFVDSRMHGNTGSKPPPARPQAGMPADRGEERRVRRGRVPFGASLDMHGHTQMTGRASLLAFVSQNRTLGETSVLVITGKGRDGQGILKTRLLEWIAEPDFRLHVSGYARANQRHGGEGAYYLFLKRITVL